MKTKGGFFHFFSTLLIVGAILVLARQIPKTNITIKDLTPVQSLGGAATNTINVEGEGKVFTKPDIMMLAVSLSETASTTAKAQDQVNQKLTQVKTILKAQGVQDKDIQTSQLTLYPEYDYTNGNSKLIGYRATHTLSIKIRNIDTQATKASALVDQIVGVPAVQLQNIAYDIEDKTPYFKQARELAFKKAEQKAQELAKLGNLKLNKPLSINESFAQGIVPQPMMRNTYAAMAEGAKDMAPSAGIAPGELEVNLSLQVVFGVE